MSYTLQNCLRSYQHISSLSEPDQRSKFWVSSHMVYGKLLTQGIKTNEKQQFTRSLVCNTYYKWLNSIIDLSQWDVKSQHIAYASYFGLNVATHTFLFDYEHYSIHWYWSKQILNLEREQPHSNTNKRWYDFFQGSKSLTINTRSTSSIIHKNSIYAK